jgi:hypothetical protein
MDFAAPAAESVLPPCGRSPVCILIIAMTCILRRAALALPERDQRRRTRVWRHLVWRPDRGRPFRRFPLVSANALRRIWTAKLNLARPESKAQCRQIAGKRYPGASGRERRALPPRQGECTVAWPSSAASLSMNSVTPSFRRISPPTISKPPNGRRLSFLKPRIGCQTAASVDRDLARWCHGVSVLGAGGLALSPHELRQLSIALVVQSRELRKIVVAARLHAIQCRDRVQWAQKSGRCNRIASDAAQRRLDKRNRDEA